MFRGQHENFAINSSLSCISDAHPTAEYRWNIIKGSGFAEGQFFVIDSPGYFNISCTAYNFLRPPDDECTAPTLYTTGYLPSGQQIVLAEATTGSIFCPYTVAHKRQTSPNSHHTFLHEQHHTFCYPNSHHTSLHDTIVWCRELGESTV